MQLTDENEEQLKAGGSAAPSSRAANQAAIMARRRRVASMLLARVSQTEIADRMGLHKSTISRDVLYLRSRWEEQADAEIREQREQEIAALDADESHLRALMSKQERVDTSAGPVVQYFHTLKERLAIYDRIARIMERRARLLGLDAPETIQGTLAVEYVNDWRPDTDWGQ